MLRFTYCDNIYLSLDDNILKFYLQLSLVDLVGS